MIIYLFLLYVIFCYIVVDTYNMSEQQREWRRKILNTFFIMESGDFKCLGLVAYLYDDNEYRVFYLQLYRNSIFTYAGTDIFTLEPLGKYNKITLLDNDFNIDKLIRIEPRYKYHTSIQEDFSMLHNRRIAYGC